MMKKRIPALVLLVMTLAACTSCGKKEETPEFTQPTPEVTAAPVETPEPEPSEEPAVETSLTSGLPNDGAEYRPMLAMIENSPAARPQTGVQQADIVYEILAESSVTRFMCLFNDTLPRQIGPIRSCRMYYLSIQKEWDAPIVHYGGPSDSEKPSYIYGSKYDYIKLRLDGLKNSACYKYFKRSSERKAPHNVYTDLQELADNFYDYTPNDRTQFTFDEAVSYENGADFTYVGLPFNTSNEDNVNFTYHPEDGLLYRAHGDTPHEIRTVTVDEQTGESKTETAQYTCVNLIVQYANTYVLSGDVKGRKNVDMVGSGDCEYFIGGKHIYGKWVRETDDDSTKYYLEDGVTPVTLRPGNTWIAVHPADKKVTVK